MNKKTDNTAQFKLIFLLIVLQLLPLYGETSFTSPKKLSAITTSKLPLAISSVDTTIDSVTYSSLMFSVNEQKYKNVSIGTVKKSPFSYTWDISAFENATTNPITLLAQLHGDTLSSTSLKQEGIYLTHNPYNPQQYELSFCDYSFLMDYLTSPITLSRNNKKNEAKISVGWNYSELYIRVVVTAENLQQYIQMVTAAQEGINIYCNSTGSKLPYRRPSDKVFIFPYKDKPYQIINNTTIKGNSLAVDTVFNHAITEKYTQTLTDKQYILNFTLPLENLQQLSEKDSPLRVNISIPFLRPDRSIERLSLSPNVPAIAQGIPFYYSYGKLEGSPLYTHPYALGLLSFLGGFILIFTLRYPALRRQKHFHSYNKRGNTTTHLSESDKQLIETIDQTIEQKFSDITFSFEELAVTVGKNKKDLTLLIKSVYNKPFDKHLLYLRIEIAKERLRSSNASEYTIAKHCGFRSVEEMHKHFESVVGQVPAQYREHNAFNS